MLKYINFANNKIQKVEFKKSILDEGRFLENKFSFIYFNECDMIRIEFVKCNLSNIDFTNDNVEGMIIDPKELKGAILNNYQACMVARMLGIVIEG